MRDKRFVAEHRGGPLSKERHRQLMKWACAGARHVLPLVGTAIRARLERVLAVADDWIKGKASVVEARQAALEAIAVAREAATAHMADHALGPALYALKAAKLAGRPVEAERRWQNGRLPPPIRELVLSFRAEKEKHLRR